MSEYVDVYRIEKNGRGPFTESANAAHLMSSSHPTPNHDAELPIFTTEGIHPFRFGCPTKKAMIEWIMNPSELEDRNFKISLYKAKKKYTHSSEIQTMFIKRHAKKVREWSVEEFCAGNI